MSCGITPPDVEAFRLIAPGLCTAVLRELALPSRSRAGQTFKGTDQRHKFRLTCQETNQ